MAHMNMADPTPLRYKGNPYVNGDVDSDITSPNTAATFPCKGALSVFSGAEGTPVAAWAPGSQQTITLEGGATHDGGSCQVSLSYDGGSNWTAIYSKIGDCPTDPKLSFTVPDDAPAGDKVLLGWTWINHTGNREYYMNCASINITGSSTKKREVPKFAKERGVSKRATAFKDRPAMFVANLFTTAGNACVKEGVDVIYPNPGPDVDNVSTSGGPPVDCATQEPITGDGDSGSGSSSSAVASAPATSVVSSSPAATSTSVYVSSSFVPVKSQPLFTNTSVTLTSLASSSPTELTSLTVIPITKTSSKTTELTSSSSTGGVFVTTPVTSATSVPTSTTLATSATVGGGAGSDSSSSAVVSKTSSAAPASGTGSTSGAQSGACTDEGQWNCLDGSSFQRCASGAWSAVMPMAAGTNCSPGMSDTLTMGRRRTAVVRRGLGAWEW
ncbi:hypothetical protein BJ170DRAFT_726500 [Xylariales sp. AK1849]|nr:hypothetical protein BJ170DRAFT_726500 [Xylariales sp. AK1849]